MTGNVVSLGSHKRFKANPAQMAQQQLASALKSSGLSEEEFAKRLTELLDWSVQPQLVQSWGTSATPPGDVLIAAGIIAQQGSPLEGGLSRDDLVSDAIQNRYGDVTAVYPTRSQLAAEISAHSLLDEAKHIQAAGLSLNLICQQYPSPQLTSQIEAGTQVALLFLDPAGEAIKAREAEEHFPAGHLANLTAVNLATMARIRDGLSADAKGRLDLRVYDETVRFNLLFVDASMGIIQPYLPDARGVDSPTFVVEATRRSGMFSAFLTVFDQLWLRGTAYE